MLHLSQTVIRQSYFFDNAIYPTEISENAVIENSPPLIFEYSQEIPTEEKTELPEQGNFLLAKNVTTHKKMLISALANTPISALWLISKLKHTSDNALDEIDIDTTESSTYLSHLRNHLDHALHCLETHGSKSFELQAAKQALVDYIASVPFYTDQIKELSNLVFFAYYSSLQQTHHYISNPSIHEAILKKLNSLSKSIAQQSLIELERLHAKFNTNASVEQFLIPADDNKHCFLVNLINLENSWLNARQQLANANHRLVLYLANQYKASFLDFNDLVQEGQSGLLKAVDRFDYQKGFQFSTYAAYWIRQAISRALIRNERAVRLPFGQMATINKLYRIKELLYSKHGYEPSTKELSTHMQLPETEINHLFYISQTATSLDISVGDDDTSMTKADFIEQQVYEPALTTILKQELINAVNIAIQTLTEKEAQVISCRFGINTSHEMTLEEIGRELNLTRERVRQIQVIAINKLKQYFGAELNNLI